MGRGGGGFLSICCCSRGLNVLRVQFPVDDDAAGGLPEKAGFLCWPYFSRFGERDKGSRNGKGVRRTVFIVASQMMSQVCALVLLGLPFLLRVSIYHKTR